MAVMPTIAATVPAPQGGPSTVGEGRCPACDASPRVLVAIGHPGMREFTRELLEREFDCWVAAEVDRASACAAIGRRHPDLVVLDAADFPSCGRAALGSFPLNRVIVIGPEPDASYRKAALAGGAGAWISRDRVGEDLGAELRRVLGCIHDPCPSSATASSLSSGTGRAGR